MNEISLPYHLIIPSLISILALGIIFLKRKKLFANGKWKDGFFNGEEITSEQKEAMRKVISDTGRNFSFITGLIFSGIISLFVFIGGKIVEYISLKRIKTTHNNV